MAKPKFKWISRLLYHIGSSWEMKGKLKCATACYTLSFLSDSDSTVSAFSLAYIELRKSNTEGALKLFIDTARHASNPVWEANSLIQAGNLLHARGEISSATQYYDNALRTSQCIEDAATRNSIQSDCYCGLGDLEFNQRRYKESLSWFNRPIEMPCTNASSPAT